MTSGSGNWDALFEGPPIATETAVAVQSRRSVKRYPHRRASGKRLDIQGLRMIAVVVVVVNHLTGHPQGGFVGVDVFFVISGFLITGQLLRDDARNGHISLFDFYRRRIRRLFPAAFLVTAATMVMAHYEFASDRAHSTYIDGLWASAFSANWHFLKIGTNYFQAEGPVSPLQHYWSLSVEEQFYLAWPLLLLTVLFIARTILRMRRSDALRMSLVVAAGITATSLYVAYKLSHSNPAAAYFSTFTRGWELGLGALLSIAAPRMRGSKLVLTVLSWAGMTAVLVSIFFVSQAHAPYPAALVPCLGAGLVVIAATAEETASNFVLTNPLSVYLGDISYSIYLVHFPVIIFAQSLVPNWTVATYLCVALVIVGLSVLQFHLVENPVRESDWLRPGKDSNHEYSTFGVVVPAVLATAVFAAGLSVLVLSRPSDQSQLSTISNIVSATAVPTPGPTATGTAPAPTPKLDALDAQIRQALLATQWPSLTPSMTASRVEPHYLAQCGGNLGAISVCTWGAAAPTHKIYLVGDSTSVAYTPAFKALIASVPGWTVRAAGGFGCPFADRFLADGPANGHASGCAARNAAIVAEVNRVKPDVLVVTTVIGSSEYVDGVKGEIAKLKGSYQKLVLLPAPPKVLDPSICDTLGSHPVDCVSKISSTYPNYLANWSALAKSYQGVMVDPSKWFCASGYCPAFVGHTPTRKDLEHMTAAYSASLGPVVLEAFRAAGILP